MAAVVTSENNALTYFSFPIEKKEQTEEINPVDGTPDIIIWGKATDGTVDSDRQIVDPVWSAGAIKQWLDTGGNIRQSHDAKKPVGKGLHVEVTPDGHYVKSLIVDPLAKHFIRSGVLNDYSVGISNPDIKYGHNKSLDPEFKAVNGIITGRQDGSSTIAEISVCDRGSNYGTKFQLATKSAAGDGAEFVGKMFATPQVVKSAPASVIKASNYFELDDEEEHVTISVPKSATINFSPASLARLLEHKRIAEEREAEKGAAEPEVEKRDFDRNVGGGVDRDALPASAFVFPGTRDFPVVTPGDVSDAATSWGRYEGSESFATFKSKLTALAHRKGAAYVAELPDAWKDTETSKAEDTATGQIEQPDLAKAAGADDGSGDGGAGARINPADAPAGAATESGAAADDDGDGAGEADAEDAGDDDGADKAAGAKAKKPKAKSDGKPFPGAAPSFDGEDTDGDGSDADTAKTTVDPEIAKAGGKTCTNCGRAYHADSKMKRCEGCNTKLPKAKTDKHQTPAPAAEPAPAAPAEAIKAGKPCDCGAPLGADHKFCASCGKKAPMPTADKALTPSCLHCGATFANAEKFCPTCGTARGATKAAEETGTGELLEKSADAGHDAKETARAHRDSPTPATGVTEAPAEQPVPEHREPDGPAIEAFEADNGIPTMPDNKVRPTKAADAFTILKNAGEPAALLALHDLTCPAYHPDAASKAHPYQGLEALDDAYWQNKALLHAAEGSLADGRRYGQLWEHSRTLKASDPTLLYQLGAEQFDAFKAANPDALPGPGSFPRPGEIHPGAFRHPYITAGHAAPSPGADGPHTATLPTGQINAGEFDRPLITAGHGDDSPGNPPTRPTPIPAPDVNGIPSRVFYTNTMRDTARQAMAAMHDHIASTFPDLCPLHGPGYAGEKPIGARPVPTPEGVPTPAMAPATKTDTTTEPADTDTPQPEAAPAEKTADTQTPTPAQPTPETAPTRTAPTRKQLRKAMEKVWSGELTIDQARTSLGLTPFNHPETQATKAIEGELVKTFTLEAANPAIDADLIKSAVAEATGPLIERLTAAEAANTQLTELNKTLGEQHKLLKKHGKILDAIAAQPDPGGPMRIPISRPTPTQTSAAPEEPLTVQKRAALAQQTALADWLEVFRNDPDPARREVAWRELNHMYDDVNARTT